MEETTVRIFRPTTGRWLIGTLSGWGILLLCFVGIGLGILLAVWIVVRFTIYTLTNQRLIIQKGVILRHVDEIELYRVKDVKLNFSVLNQIVNIGNIEIRSSDPTTPRDTHLTLFNIYDAKSLRETFRELVEASRRERGVREVDAGIIDRQTAR
jgi:uncharacterized membrane protein YdbT with pleckstrin-like domain